MFYFLVDDVVDGNIKQIKNNVYGLATWSNGTMHHEEWQIQRVVGWHLNM